MPRDEVEIVSNFLDQFATSRSQLSAQTKIDISFALRAIPFKISAHNYKRIGMFNMIAIKKSLVSF